ncbi:MAG: VWA domain-containing protein [Candidatus Hodarchaeales archaeon]
MIDKDGNLKIKLEPSNKYALTQGDTRMYLMLKLEAPEIEPVEGRVPFNLGVVLDRSGSMGGKKIEKAKKAVEIIIENLLRTDIFSLVIYDDIIETIVPAAKIKDKFSILKRLEQVTARSMTNLHGGMLEGAKQIESNKSLEYKNIMFLLSDGLANVGITDRSQMRKEAKRINMDHGITISTFGIGDDFDEDMMVGIADAASGEFYYIQNADEIPKYIENEFKGLLQTVASSIQVGKLNLAKGVKLNRILGVGFEDQTKTSHNLGDLRSSGERIIIFDLTVPGGKNDTSEQILSFEISYIDSNLDRISREDSFEVLFTDNEELLTTENQRVLDYVALLETAYVREEALLDADRGDFKSARAKIAAQQEKLKHRASKPGSLAQINEIMAQNVGFLENTLQKQMYSKASRKTMKSASYELRKQRKAP